MENESKNRNDEIQPTIKSGWSHQWTPANWIGVSVAALIWVLLGLSLIAHIVKGTSPGASGNPSSAKFVTLGLITFGFAGFCLLLRSLRTHLGFWRGVFTFIGALIVSQLAGRFFLFGPLKDILANFLILLAGLILLAVGFRPQRGLLRKKERF